MLSENCSRACIMYHGVRCRLTGGSQLNLLGIIGTASAIVLVIVTAVVIVDRYHQHNTAPLFHDLTTTQIPNSSFNPTPRTNPQTHASSEQPARVAPAPALKPLVSLREPKNPKHRVEALAKRKMVLNPYPCVRGALALLCNAASSG